MANESLRKAQGTKNDEFYTVFEEIEKEMNAYLEFNPDVFRDKTILLPCDDPDWSNFTKFFAQKFNELGIKKLISTSYAVSSKPANFCYQLSLFEINSPEFDEVKTDSHGKIFTLTRKNKKVNINDLDWKYLNGDGDFRSDEVKALRDEADIIITNPPFSKFREFIAWILEADKKFIVIGNQNAITYKEIFPYLKDNKMWIGATTKGQDMVFGVPEGTEVKESDKQKAEKLAHHQNVWVAKTLKPL